MFQTVVVEPKAFILSPSIQGHTVRGKLRYSLTCSACEIKALCNKTLNHNNESTGGKMLQQQSLVDNYKWKLNCPGKWINEGRGRIIWTKLSYNSLESHCFNSLFHLDILTFILTLQKAVFGMVKGCNCCRFLERRPLHPPATLVLSW